MTDAVDDDAPDSGSHDAGADEGPCIRCGAEPGYYVEFDQNIGLLLYRHMRIWKGVACRDCAIGIGRQYLRRTLLTGWWGAISLPANLFAVRHNLGVLRELRDLPDLPGPTKAS